MRAYSPFFAVLLLTALVALTVALGCSSPSSTPPPPPLTPEAAAEALIQVCKESKNSARLRELAPELGKLPPEALTDCEGAGFHLESDLAARSFSIIIFYKKARTTYSGDFIQENGKWFARITREHHILDPPANMGHTIGRRAESATPQHNEAAPFCR